MEPNCLFRQIEKAYKNTSCSLYNLEYNKNIVESSKYDKTLLFSFILLYSSSCRKNTEYFRIDKSFSGKSENIQSGM